MMNIKSTLLWRVDWVHRNGYQAPTYYVEAKTRREAIAEAKAKSRFADFSKTWFCRIICEGEPS